MPNLFYAVGYMLLSLWGYVFYHWQWMLFATALWPCLFFLVVAFIPESYRWYFSKGRFEKGKKAICCYASRCGVYVPKESLDRMCADQTDGLRTHKTRRSLVSSGEYGEKNALAKKVTKTKMEVSEHVYTIGDLFKTPEIRWLTLKMCFLYFTRFAIYYAVFMIDIRGEAEYFTCFEMLLLTSVDFSCFMC